MSANHPFNVIVTDANGAVVSQAFVLNLAAASIAPTITSAQDTGNYTNGAAWVDSQTTATGTAPIVFSLTGAPSGVSIDPNTGAVSGTAAVAPGSYAITKIASNGVAPNATQAYALTVSPAIPTIQATSASQSSLTVGSSNCYPGASVTYTISPGGVSQSATCGTSVLFSGLSASTAYTIVATQSFGGQASAQSVAITATTTAIPPTTAQVTTPVSSVSWQAGAISSFANSASGTAPITWSASGLPSGMAINPSTGLVSGVPASSGSGTFSVTATNAGGSDTKTISYGIVAAPTAPAITSGSQMVGVLGQPQSLQVSATGTGPLVYSIAPYPGIVIDPNSGLVTASATAQAGTVSLTVTGPGGVATQSIQVLRQPQGDVLIPVMAGAASNQQVSFSQGSSPIACTVSPQPLPAWLAWNDTLKRFTWNASAPANTIITITLSCDNCAGKPSIKTFTFWVR